MYKEDIEKVIKASETKKNFIKKNPPGYIISSILAGLYVGLAIILIFTIGAFLSSEGSPLTRTAMGACFGAALSIVIMAGSELFTGNTFVMTIGVLQKRTSITDMLKIYIASYAGNLIGGITAAALYIQTGLAKGVVGEFILSTSAAKMTGEPVQLLFRGILCNILVCIAVWCSFKLKEEAAKLIIIFWCLFIFITSGFEHSIANMTLLSIGLMIGGNADVTLIGFVNNLAWVTIGNIIGGAVFVALPYYIISKTKE